MPPICKAMPPQRRRHSPTAAVATSAQMSNTKWLLTFVLLGLLAAAAGAVDEKKSTELKTVQPAPSASPASSTLSASSVAPRDEIYIDDEGIEGSGGRGEIHDDLEKDPDYSGSGFGPDDEDSTTDHHRRPSIQTQSGRNSGKSQNSNSDNDFITSRTSSSSNSGTIIGSGGSSSDSNSGLSNSGINSIAGNNQGTIHELDATNVNSLPTDTKVEHTTGNEVLIMNASDDDRTTSFFAQPGILAAVIGGAVVGLLCAILVVMFIVYRMRKKDEGSYALDEPKRSPAVNSYAKNANNREFYA